jgi:DNA-binding transcriptional regulator YhcF (GntR family)
MEEAFSITGKAAMRKRIHEALSLEIERTILNDPSYRLPRLFDLAAQHGVSYLTIWRAVQLLARKGIVVRSPGRRLCISPKIRGREMQEGMPCSEAERIYRILRNAITDGTYRVGKYLPKINYFLRTYDTSYHTISRVFARLRAENLAHKQRNRWVAGPVPAASAPSGMADQGHGPVVLVVVEGPEVWNKAFTNNHTRNFMLQFTTEMMAWRTNLSVAALDQDYSMAYVRSVGLGEIKETARALGPRYCGTLILNAFPNDMAVDLSTCIVELTKYKKPVVFFDSSGQGSSLTRKSLGIQRYYRLCFDEASAVRAALELLARNGHRVIGVHGSDLDPGGWPARRTNLIEEIARASSLHIVRSGPSEEYWNMRNLSIVDELITTIVQQPARPGFSIKDVQNPAQRKLLVHNAPSLVSLFAKDAPTAMIALNDRLAREYYFWFDALGVAIPRDFSLISFDNIPESVFFPITTIDFGFTRLGYCAAHIIIGDIPVHAGTNGVVNSVCTVVDRGSVAKAAEEGRVRHLLRACQ